MPRALLFNHPGREHVPATSGALYPWNTMPAPHRRKFLRVQARRALPRAGQNAYALEAESNSVTLWAEWEPCSRAWLFLSSPDRSLPKAWHEPILTCQPPANAHNTDPWIFGEEMRYSNCRQGKTPGLRQLQVGDVVLFGSLKKCIPGDGFDFLLDTVFVIGSRHPYHPSGADTIPVECRSDSVFVTSVLACTSCGPGDPVDGFVLYGGTMLKDGAGSPFCWVPSMSAPHGGGRPPPRFPRPMISHLFRDAHFANPRQPVVWLSAESTQVWRTVVQYCLGLKLDMAAQVEL